MPRPEANQSPTWLFLHSTDATPSTFLFSIKAIYYFLHLPSFRLHFPARQPQIFNSHKTTMPVPPTPCTRSTQILLCPGCEALPAPKPTTYDLAHDACRVSTKRVCDTYLQEHPAGIRRTGWRSWGCDAPVVSIEVHSWMAVFRVRPRFGAALAGGASGIQLEG